MTIRPTIAADVQESRRDANNKNQYRAGARSPTCIKLSPDFSTLYIGRITLYGKVDKSKSLLC